jgi:hypothetical protein
MANFSPLIANIDTGALVARAKSVRADRERRAFSDCTLVTPPIYGSSNLVHVLRFADGVKWVARIPVNGVPERYTNEESHALRSEALTMRFIKRMTTIPLPEVYDFDSDVGSVIGAPYMLMNFVEGLRASDVWSDGSGPTPLRDRRLRILDTIAEAMSQLHQFSFPSAGLLEFDAKTGLFILGVGGYPEIDVSAGLEVRRRGVDSNRPRFRRTGPFSTSRDFFLSGLALRDHHSSYASHKGALRLLRMMIKSLPVSYPPSTPPFSLATEDFVLAPFHFDESDFLVAEDGGLACIHSWDGVMALPRCIGYARYPAWITRDWDPSTYGNLAGRTADSPQELERFRAHYNETIRRLLGPRECMPKSHFYEALWAAAASPNCMPSIVENICRHCFRVPLFDVPGAGRGREHSSSDDAYPCDSDDLSGASNRRQSMGDFRHWYSMMLVALGKRTLDKDKVDLLRRKLREFFAK